MESVTNGTPPPALQREQGSAAGTATVLFDDFGRFSTIVDWAAPSTRDLDDMLRRDGKARSLEQVLTLPLMAAGRLIEPQAGDQGEAEFVREALTRPANGGGMVTPIGTVVAQLAAARVYRRAFFEKVYAPRDGRLVLRKLAHRPASTCKVLRDKRDQSFQGFRQKFTDGNGKPREETFGPDKALVHLHGQHKDPLGGSTALETCWQIYETKQKVRFLWLSFLENQNIPKGIAHHSNGDPAEARKFAETVATLKGGGVIGVGPDQDVSAFESSGRGAAEFREAMNWLSAEQSASVLAGFTDLTSQAASGRGSYALSRDASDLFLRSCQGALREMGDTLSSFCVADLVRWNFGPDGVAPLFVFGDLADHDADAARELFSELSGRERLDPRIPGEFLDELTVKVAHHLDLDVDKVAKALEARGAQTPGDRLRVGVDRAAALVEEALPDLGGAAG